MRANMMRVVVEFLALGHIEQQSEHAALPKQQAIDGNANKAPIFSLTKGVTDERASDEKGH